MIAAETEESAAAQHEAARRIRARALFGRGQKLSEDDITALLGSPQAAAVDEMLAYTAVGAAEEVAAYLESFAAETGADELITVALLRLGAEPPALGRAGGGDGARLASPSSRSARRGRAGRRRGRLTSKRTWSETWSIARSRARSSKGSMRPQRRQIAWW